MPRVWPSWRRPAELAGALVILSRQRGFLFLHVAKSAGTSVTAAYTPHALWDDLILGGSPYGRRLRGVVGNRFGLDTHSRPALIRSVIGDELWESSWRFAVTREPIERTVSMYAYLEQQYLKRSRLERTLGPRRNPTKRPWSWPGMQLYLDTADFAEFIRDDRLLSALPLQTSMLLDEAGELQAHHVTRLDQLSDEWPTLAERMGIPGAELPRKNTSGASGPKPTVTAADRRVLEEVLAPDYEALGY